MAAITVAEYAARLEKLQHTLSACEIDLAILNRNTDLFYYTGSVQPLYLMVPSVGQPLVLARKALGRIRAEVTDIPLAEFTGSKDLIAAVAGYTGVRRLAFTLDTAAYATVARLQQLFPGAELADISWEVRTLRMVKSPAEQEIFTRGGAIIAELPRVVREAFRPGITELELSAAIEYFFRLHHGDALVRCRKEGVEMSAFGVCSSGVNSLAGTKFDGVCGGSGLCAAVPYGASDTPIARDVPVVLDYGFIMEGYHHDLTRTLVWGKPSDEVTRAYAAMLQIQQAVCAALTPGTPWEEPYAIAVELAKKLGYTDTFMGCGPEQVKFVGHGLGLELDEPPYLAPRMRDPLAAGMVIAVEPKVALPGIGVVGPEDNYLITDDGLKLLTDCPSDMIVLTE